jgi:histidyl-tRNA synthetase
MDLLSRYLDAFGIVDKVSFDLSLARGLDYYTGLIFEVVTKPLDPVGIKDKSSKGILLTPNRKNGGEDQSSNSQIGSIAAGGRYDNLVRMYGKRELPCIGVSFGVDRIFTIMKARREKESRQCVRETDVYIMAFGGGSFNGLLLERMAVARQLWDAGIKTEFAAKVKPKLPQQFKAAEDIPLAVILGDDELANGQVRLKVLGLRHGDVEKDQGRLVSREDLVSEIKKLL